MQDIIELLRSCQPNENEWRSINRLYIAYIDNKWYRFLFFKKSMYRRYFIVIEYNNFEIEKFEIPFSEKEKSKKYALLLTHYIKMNYK